MKKLLCLSIAALCVMCVSSDAMAEVSWDLGVKHGYNLTRLTSDEADPLTERYIKKRRVVAGMFVTVHTTNWFAVQVEGLYSQKGGEGEQAGVNFALELNYFEIPVLFVFAYPAAERFLINGFLGPVFAFSTSATAKERFGDTTVALDVDGTTGLDFGGAIGTGVTFGGRRGVKIIVDGRGTFGFRSFHEALDLKNIAYSLMVGVAFPL